MIVNQILERSEVAGTEALVRYLYAIHEAAHAVVGWATGREIIHVTIIPKGFSRGRTRFDRLPAHLDLESPGNRALADREAMIGLAGVIAERRCLGERWRATPSPTDFTLMSSVGAQAIHSRVALESYLDRLARQVSVLLDLHWSRVEIVALALFEEGELTGKAVKKLMSSSQ
jgi:hypothetical protein